MNLIENFVNMTTKQNVRWITVRLEALLWRYCNQQFEAVYIGG